MVLTDYALFSTSNGADISVQGSRIITINGYENMPILALFGATDFWGNNILFDDVPSRQVNSKTLAALYSNPLNARGLALIEDAIKQDLQFLVDNIPGTNFTVETGIFGNPRMWQCKITFSGKEFYMNFNPVTSQLNYSVA